MVSEPTQSENRHIPAFTLTNPAFVYFPMVAKPEVIQVGPISNDNSGFRQEIKH
jgi:hypothetical protein